MRKRKKPCDNAPICQQNHLIQMSKNSDAMRLKPIWFKSLYISEKIFLALWTGVGCNYQHYNIGRNRSYSTWLRWNAYILKHAHTYYIPILYKCKYAYYYYGLEHLRTNHVNKSIYPCNYLHWRGKAVTASSHSHRPAVPGCHSDKPKRGRRHGNSRRDGQSIAPVITKDYKRETTQCINSNKIF